MKTLLERNGILAIHLAIVALLLVGLVERSGIQFIPDLGIYLISLLLAYTLIGRLLPASSKGLDLGTFTSTKFIQAVLFLQLVLMAAHWAYLGGIPLWEAMHEQDDLRIVNIRRAAGEDIPLLMSYASHFMIKAFVPFALLLAWSEHRRLFWLLAITAAVYAVSLLAKSFVITLFIPLWIAFLIARQWLRFFTLSGAFLVLTVALSTAANPQKLRSGPEIEEAGAVLPEDEGVNEHGFLLDAVLGVGRRMVLMPGWTVAEWFQHIPADIPFAQGGAVRPLAVVLSVPYVDFTEKVYALAYPEMAAQNVPGTMGTASFMYGYANFGRWGLFGSGVITAFMLLLFQRVFASRWKWAVVLNTFPLLALSGSALPTVLLTHGWALTIVLFLWLRPKHDPGT